jgi:hypothetical protein
MKTFLSQKSTPTRFIFFAFVAMVKNFVGHSINQFINQPIASQKLSHDLSPFSSIPNFPYGIFLK